MINFIIGILFVIKFVDVLGNFSPYHGFIKELEILDYNKSELTQKLETYLDERKKHLEATLMFTISTKNKVFDFCLRSKRHDHVYNLAKNYYFDGILCSNPNTKSHGYIHEGVFFGRVEEELPEGGILKYVFSDITYLKNISERSKGHSIFYTSDQLDHEFLSKNIKRNHHYYQSIDKKSPSDDYEIKIVKSEVGHRAVIISGQNQTISEEAFGFGKPRKSTIVKHPKNICTTHIDFHPTYVGEDRTIHSAVLEVMTMFESVNDIFAKNFKDDNQNPLIQYIVTSYRLLDEKYLTSINQHLPIVNDVLDHYNDEPMFKNQFCASVLLTHTNWAQTLGMAKIGTEYGVGICGNNAHSVVTSNLLGDKLDVLSIENTIVHELGHNLGSIHDPDTDCKKSKCPTQAEINECSPGGKNGMFIMYYSSNTGAFPNNHRFSPCSKRVIMPFLKLDSRRKCFKEKTDPICGNGVVEENEICDSGSESDGCCQMINGNGKKACTLIANKACSPSMGPCCNLQCMFSPASTDCHKSTDCSGNSRCNGSSATCPIPSFSPQNTVCAHSTKGCDGRGTCNLSLCQVTGKMDCDCPDKGKECVICCKDSADGKCAPINFNGKPSTYKLKGNLCKSGKGICDDSHECLEKIDDSGFALFWMKLTGGQIKEEIVKYIVKRLWIIGVALGSSLVVISILTCVFNKDTSKYLKKMYDIEQKRLDHKYSVSMQNQQNNKQISNKNVKQNISSRQNIRVCSEEVPNLETHQSMYQMGYNPNFALNPMQNTPFFASQQFIGPNNPHEPRNSRFNFDYHEPHHYPASSQKIYTDYSDRIDLHKKYSR